MNKTMTLLLLLSLGLCLTNLAWGNTNSTSSDTLPPQLIQRKAPGTRLVSNAVLLQASGGDEYQWSTGATTSSINIETPTSPQKYSVHIKRRKTHQNWVLQQIVYPEQIDKNQSIAQFGCQNLGLSWQSSVCAGASVTIHATGGNSYEWDTGETTSSITVFPTNGKVYTVKITGIDDCNVTLSTASAPMVVIPVPDAKITVSNNECSAIGAILTASGGEAYLWAGGQTTQSIVTDEAVLYEVKVSNGNGLCTDTESIWVTTNFKPEISGEAQLCQGQGTTLTASGGNTYLWANGATNSSITVLPSDVGTHTYKVQVTAGICSREVSRTITVKAKPTATILGPDKTCNNGSVTLTSSGTGTYKWSTGATTSSINLSLLQSNQTYGLTITDPITKCSSADEHVVNVLPKPTLNDIPNSICAGASVNLSVSGGSSYSWNVGGTTASIVHSPSEFTEYRVTVTDANGCVYSLSKIVNVEALPRITFGGETSICAGQSLNVTAFGGQSYRWDYNNSKTATITVSPTQNTTYTVTATSAGGCTSSAQRVIQVKTPATGAIVGASSICPGQSLILTASGVGTYRWSENNATTSSIQVSPSQNTTYSLLITNAEGCTFQTSHSVSVNLTGSASNDGPLTCSKTTALLQANTGAAGASFSWRNASGVEIASSANTSVNTPGVYSLVITGAGGCSYTTATEVLVNRVNPSMTLSQNGPITCTKPNVVLSASPSTPGASYAWQWRNSAGTVLGTAASIGVSQPGVYTLRATDTNGCTAEQSLSVGADVTPPVLSTVSNDGPLSCTKTNVVLSASSSTPGVTFTWKNAGGTPLGYNASTSVSTVGTYVVEVQGSNGCKISQSTQVGQTGTFPNISVNQPAPISCTNPQTWVSGGSNTAGVTYEWRNANNRVVATQSGFNAQMPGEYTLKVTAPNGCSSSSLVMVEDEVWVSFDWLVDGKAINFWENANYQSRSITCSKSSVSVGLPGSNSSNGTFVLITPQGSSLNLYPGNTRTLTLPGAYRLEMTQSGCTRRKELLIVEDRTPPVVKIEGNTELCGSGSTTLLASGGNKYKWSTGATTASLALGTLSSTSSYTVTVTGLNGCTASKPATVNIHPIPQATPQHAGAFCLDAGQLAVGTLAVSASGGTAPYSYRWDNGQSTAGVSLSSPSSLSMGVTVTDSKGCFTTTSASLMVNRRPYAQILGGEMACAGESPTLIASGGSTFLWSNNATSSSIAISQPTQNQTYSVTVSNVPGCVGFASKTVVVPAALSVGHTTAGTDDCVANNAQVIPSLSGGTGNITLSLFRSGEVEPLPSLNGLKSGTYLLKAQDSKGCTAQREVVIAETPIEISSLTLSKVDDCIPGNTQLNISTKGDRLPLVYRLDGVVQSGATITLPREERTYSIEVSDAAGCVVSREEYYEDYDAVRVYEHNISPVTDCSTPNGALHFHYVGKPGSEQKDYSISVDGGTTWHTNTNLVLNLRPGIYQTAARNDQAGCVVQGPQVQITAPDCLPEAGFTQSTLHITSPTQRIALPWRVEKRAWGNADKPFSLRIYRVEDGKPHFVDPNVATATEPLEKSVEPGAGFTIEYAVDFAGSDERELVLQPNAKDYLEPGFYTFMMEGEGVDVDPFRKKITVIVDLDGRVIVVPFACKGGPIRMAVADPKPQDCYYWPDFPNERGSVVNVSDYTPGKTYRVEILRDLKIIPQLFVGDALAQENIPYQITSSLGTQLCKGEHTFLDVSTKPGKDATGWSFKWKDLINNSSENHRRVDPETDQTFTLEITNKDGCKYELSQTITVADPKLELAKINPEMPTICKGGNTTLGVEIAEQLGLKYGYAWTYDQDANFKRFTKEIKADKTEGQYYVTVSALIAATNRKCAIRDQNLGPVRLTEETFESAYNKLEAMGFKPYPCRLIKTPASRATPELRDACTGVEDFSEVREIEWDATIVDLKQRVCDDVAAANAEGFAARGYLFEDICDEGLNFQRIMRDVLKDPHNMDQVIVYLDRKNSDDDVFFQYFEEYDKFIEETINTTFEEEFKGKDCQFTFKIATVGATLSSWQSWTVQLDYLRYNLLAVAEFQIPFANKDKNRAGHVDLAVPFTGEMFEVKPGMTSPVATEAERKQLERYISQAITYCMPTLWRKGTNYPILGRYMPHAADPMNKVLYAYLSEPGIIKWRELDRNDVQNPPIPPVIPPIIYPNRTLERLQRHFGDIKEKLKELQQEIEEDLKKSPKELEEELKKWLRDNPEILEFLKDQLKIAAITGGIVIIVATIAEDIATGLLGTLDDAASFALATRLFQIAATL